jgi:Na+-translocating ferredoxin:NAD+ oxidoreductase subunit B
MANKIAYIRESECIGCTKCISACSDQAILGARKLMHTIITDLCTGCEDCIAPCPVDCIEMIEKPEGSALTTQRNNHNIPLNASAYAPIPASMQAKKDLIAEAIERTKAKRAWSQGKKDETSNRPRDL